MTDTFTVSVTNNAPTFTAPGAMTVEATNASGAVVAFPAAGQDVEDPGPTAAAATPARTSASASIAVLVLVHAASSGPGPRVVRGANSEWL